MVPLIPCRRVDDHTVTADIPETGLKHLRAFEPVKEDERKRLGYTDADEQEPPATPPADNPPTPKPRRSAAGKNNEE